jgi:regulator of RNase E activity RraA
MELSQDERNELLSLFADLRVADVRDGMDWNMLHDQGSLAPEIRPVWRTRAVGIARTARYLPYSGEMPKMTPEEYTQWQGWYYNHVCTYPWVAEVVPGDFVMIDASGTNVGLCGSNNTLECVRRGVRGFASDGGARDTDELILQKVPFWARYCSQSMVQARLQYDAHNVPVQVGGVTVNPGDVVVADGDGVIVVPRKWAVKVARYAHQELHNDKESRRKMYEEMGLSLDESVE